VVLNHHANINELFQHMKVGDMDMTDMIGPSNSFSLQTNFKSWVQWMWMEKQTCDIRFLSGFSGGHFTSPKWKYHYCGGGENHVAEIFNIPSSTQEKSYF